MSYIFLDESGDLGFNFAKKNASKFFIITVLFTSDKKQIEKVVKKTHATLKKQHKQRGGVLHAYKETYMTKKRLLTKLNEKDIMILCIYLNKSRVYTKLKNEKEILYNYVTNILLDRIFSRKLLPVHEKICLVASRKETNKFLNENFKSYLSSQTRKNHRLDLGIEIKTPHEEKCLQAVDFASWAIFRKYEHGDESYYDLFKSKIFEERSLF
jgi:Protein of unknown function (DUF3800)